MLDSIPTLLLLLWFGLPLAAWLFRLVGHKRIHGIVLYGFTLVIGYFLFLGCAWAADVSLEQRMNSFDLDGDGGIGGAELTPEAQEAMDDWASDTGRALAFITGIPVTAIWAALCLVPLCVGEWIVRRVIAKRNPEMAPVEISQHERGRRNPYRP